MTEIIPTARSRCSEGWLLFWYIGDLYTIEILKEAHVRDWRDHQKAVDQHREHINDCQDCKVGINRVREEIEEQAV